MVQTDKEFEESEGSGLPHRALSTTAQRTLDAQRGVDEALAKIRLRKQNAGNADDTNLLELFCRACLAATDLANSAPALTLIDSQSLMSQDKRFVAICLLRLFDADNALFDRAPQDFRVAAWKVLDSSCGDIYQQSGISARNQTYEKLAALRPIVGNATGELARIRGTLTDLGGFKSWRRDFMRAITRPLVKAVVLKFVPDGINDKTRMETLLTAIADYDAADELGKLSAVERVRDLLAEVREDARLWPTEFVQTLLAPIFQNVAEVIENDFNSTAVAKPASLSILPSQKKYALAEVGVSFDFRVRIQNSGPGLASNIVLQLCLSSNITPENHEIILGRVPPYGSSGELSFPCTVCDQDSLALGSAMVRWTNSDGSIGETSSEFTIASQKSAVDWASLARSNPYTLEPVTVEDQLVGRTEILNKLVSSISARTVGSFYIKGQKRVGKTSIVNTLSTLLPARECAFIYIDSGDYRDKDASVSVSQLGELLVDAIRDSDPRFQQLSASDFKGSLIPLVNFVKTTELVSPSSRFVIVLDEFDELPVDLLLRTPIADAFFATIRSLSNRANLGFILVGGEKMKVILQNHGMPLNKFQSIEVSYLDIENHWPDFKELVQGPVRAWLDIEDDAVRRLHHASAGNPYFAKILCAELYSQMVNHHDAHATPHEVEQAIAAVTNTIPTSRFQHFWEDGILEELPERRDKRIIDREKVLVGFGQLLRSNPSPMADEISVAIQDMAAYEVERELRELCDRQVLTAHDGGYQCKVPLFSEWLKTKGVGELLGNLIAQGDAVSRQEQVEKARVPEKDIHTLSEKWGFYQGLKVSEERIRAWLEQFSSAEEQRLMMRLLEGVRFYSTAAIREKMREGQRLVQAELTARRVVTRQEPGKRKRGDILVSHLDRFGKSGGHYGTLYGEVNDIYADNIISREVLRKELLGREGITGLVLIDDFIGSGKSLNAGLKQLSEDIGDVLEEKDIVTVVVLISGFQKARDIAAERAQRLGLNIQIRICDPLAESDRCFHEHSTIFQDLEERTLARKVAYKWGALLERAHPLGWDESEALVVFDNNCPNNTLPFLWKTGKDWVPLFPRV